MRDGREGGEEGMDGRGDVARGLADEVGELALDEVHQGGVLRGGRGARRGGEGGRARRRRRTGGRDGGGGGGKGGKRQSCWPSRRQPIACRREHPMGKRQVDRQDETERTWARSEAGLTPTDGSSSASSSSTSSTVGLAELGAGAWRPPPTYELAGVGAPVRWEPALPGMLRLLDMEWKGGVYAGRGEGEGETGRRVAKMVGRAGAG